MTQETNLAIKPERATKALHCIAADISFLNYVWQMTQETNPAINPERVMKGLQRIAADISLFNHEHVKC